MIKQVLKNKITTLCIFIIITYLGFEIAYCYESPLLIQDIIYIINKCIYVGDTLESFYLKVIKYNQKSYNYIVTHQNILCYILEIRIEELQKANVNEDLIKTYKKILAQLQSSINNEKIFIITSTVAIIGSIIVAFLFV